MSDFSFSHRGFSTVEQTYDRSTGNWKSRIVRQSGELLEEWEGLTHPADVQREDEERDDTGKEPIEGYPFLCEECETWHWFENNFSGGKLAFQHFQQCHPTGWFYTA